MLGLILLTSGTRLLPRRSTLVSASLPATLNATSNKGCLGARGIATSPTPKLEWEPGLAQLIDKLPLTENRHVVNDKQLIDQAGRLHDHLEIYEAMAMDLKHYAMKCEGEMLTILKENMDVVKWNHGTSESPEESNVEGKWPKLVEWVKYNAENRDFRLQGLRINQKLEKLAERENLIAKTRDEKSEPLGTGQKLEKEQHLPEGVAKDKGLAELTSSLQVLKKHLTALYVIEIETMESRKILDKGVEGFREILRFPVEPIKVSKMFPSLFPIPSSSLGSQQEALTN